MIVAITTWCNRQCSFLFRKEEDADDDGTFYDYPPFKLFIWCWAMKYSRLKRYLTSRRISCEKHQHKHKEKLNGYKIWWRSSLIKNDWQLGNKQVYLENWTVPGKARQCSYSREKTSALGISSGEFFSFNFWLISSRSQNKKGSFMVNKAHYIIVFKASGHPLLLVLLGK